MASFRGLAGGMPGAALYDAGGTTGRRAKTAMKKALDALAARDAREP
jgi:hypothetical protein